MNLTSEAPGPTATPAPAVAPGLRERRRLQTRTEISEAALRLFEQDGVDATTVDRIADEAGVSQRTFFRYFTSKEEAALPVHWDFDAAVVAALPGVDAGVDPRSELERLYAVALPAFADNSSAASVRMLRVNRLVRREPQLRSALVRHNESRAELLLSALLAAYEARPVTELQVRLAVGVTEAVVRAALETWVSRLEDGRDASLPEIYAAACELGRR